MIVVIDYGLGNVQAFLNIYKSLGIKAARAQSVGDLSLATHLILPGVGSFDLAIQLLQDSDMLPEVERLVMEDKIPILGVCVGMQMLAGRSEEGSRSGLNWIPGEVRRIRADHTGVKVVPHMGWNEVSPLRNNPLFDGEGRQEFYFLHSYHFVPDDKSAGFAEFEYGDEMVCGVARDNIFGVQFHPEKSHGNGISLLRNFSKI